MIEGHPIHLSGINGISNNLHVAFHNVVEKIIEAAAASPNCKDVDNNTLASLIHHAILTYNLDYVNIKETVEALRNNQP